MIREISQSHDLTRKTNRKWEELPSLLWNLFFLIFLCFFVRCFCPFCPCVWAERQSSSTLFHQLISVQCIMERSIARRGCVTTSVCVCVCVCVCVWVWESVYVCVGVCVLLSWKHAAGLALQQLGGAMLHRGNLLVRLSSWCPWTPCWRSWSPSGWSRRWPPAPDWTRSGTGTLTSAATSRPRGSSAAPRRLASPTASARPASRTPASPSSPSPADRGAFILLLKMTSLERNAVCVCVCVWPWWCRWLSAAPPVGPVSVERHLDTETTAGPAWGTSASEDKNNNNSRQLEQQQNKHPHNWLLQSSENEIKCCRSSSVSAFLQSPV